MRPALQHQKPHHCRAHQREDRETTKGGDVDTRELQPPRANRSGGIGGIPQRQQDPDVQRLRVACDNLARNRDEQEKEHRGAKPDREPRQLMLLEPAQMQPARRPP